MKEDIIITNIQRFSLSDGPGIRTTIFLKGCSLKCPWCANPENINFEIEEYNYENQKGKYGYIIEENELYNIIKKDIKYYENGGGVTFSGGEPLFQVKKMKNLLEKLKKEKINICFETSLFVPKKYLELAINYADEFIVDLKILDKDMCKDVLNGEIEQYYKNIKYIFENFKSEKIVFRIPITLEYVLNNNYVKLYLDFIKKYKPKKVEIFRLHHLGDKKHKTLNKEIFDFKYVPDEKIKEFKNELEKYTKVEILDF